MEAGRTKSFAIALACLVWLSIIPPVCAKPSEKEIVLRACERLFGPTVDAKQNLFEVNQAFALQVKFNKRGRLVECAVWPKYTFNETHPDWKEPDSFPYLSQAEYKDLIGLLDTVKRRGKLIKPRSNIAVVTNSTAYYKEIYEHALLELYELSDGQGIRSFKLEFLKSRAT